MVVLKPGDVVVFKKNYDNQLYRDRNNIQEPMTLRNVDNEYVYWSHGNRERSCYVRRVELQEGPW